MDTGIKVKYMGVPTRQADTRDEQKLSVFHMFKVLEKRGEDDNINLVLSTPYTSR